jgi:two-component system, NtrC family, nitrogen regulation response regulator NtrX
MGSQSDTILVVDDDSALLATLSRTLELAGFKVESAQEPEEAKRLLKQDEIHALLLDLQLPGVVDLEALEWVRAEFPTLPVVMMTAFGTVDKAVRALKMGAYDFIEKPIDRDRLLLALRNAVEKGRLERERSGLLRSLRAQHEIIGDSKAILELCSVIDRVAPIDARVLIVGETGTGKEVVANALFSRSSRASKPFIKVNCAAIPRELIESELFGHRKGAFTGAIENKPGKFKLADGGTIFLDEIGDMELAVQAKVLRALQEGEVEPVGGRGPEKVDVRVMAATNQDLEGMAKDGRFRQDLYYRLKGVVLRVPPLRERLEDVKPLMEHFLNEIAGKSNRPALRLHSSALQMLLQHNWPGNVRELESLANWLTVFASGVEVKADDLVGWFGGHQESRQSASEISEYNKAKESFEREYFKRLLITMEGNMSAVARAAGLDRSGLYRKLKSLGIVE